MSAQRATSRKRRVIGLLALVILGPLGAIAVWQGLLTHGNPYTPPPIAFDGSSDELANTVIVPTLDTPMPEGKNVIWCASFQLAWNEMRDEIVGEPIRIANAEEIAAHLNAGKASKDDLEPADYYVKAGAVADGVIEQIQRDMARRFPDAQTPQIEASEEAVVAYAYLAANVEFTVPFFENNEEFLFGSVPVSSFGVREQDAWAYRRLRSQVEVLYLIPRDSDMFWAYGHRNHPNAFALDLCTGSSPYQVIVARVEPKQTLSETLDDLDEKIADWDGAERERRFGQSDVLLVPTTSWRVRHHFVEIEGTDKVILNENCPISGFWNAEASQMIDFRLDRSGASLRSEAKYVVRSGRRFFTLNRPFLIVMKQRGAEEPFFVMWVANAELLCKP